MCHTSNVSDCVKLLVAFGTRSLIDSYKREPFTDCNAINFFNSKSASDELILNRFTRFDRSEEGGYHCHLDTSFTSKMGFEMAMQEHGDEAEDVTLLMPTMTRTVVIYLVTGISLGS